MKRVFPENQELRTLIMGHLQVATLEFPIALKDEDEVKQINAIAAKLIDGVTPTTVEANNEQFWSLANEHVRGSEISDHLSALNAALATWFAHLLADEHSRRIGPWVGCLPVGIAIFHEISRRGQDLTSDLEVDFTDPSFVARLSEEYEQCLDHAWRAIRKSFPELPEEFHDVVVSSAAMIPPHLRPFVFCLSFTPEEIDEIADEASERTSDDCLEQVTHLFQQYPSVFAAFTEATDRAHRKRTSMAQKAEREFGELSLQVTEDNSPDFAGWVSLVANWGKLARAHDDGLNNFSLPGTAFIRVAIAHFLADWQWDPNERRLIKMCANDPAGFKRVQCSSEAEFSMRRRIRDHFGPLFREPNINWPQSRFYLTLQDEIPDELRILLFGDVLLGHFYRLVKTNQSLWLSLKQAITTLHIVPMGTVAIVHTPEILGPKPKRETFRFTPPAAQSRAAMPVPGRRPFRSNNGEATTARPNLHDDKQIPPTNVTLRYAIKPSTSDQCITTECAFADAFDSLRELIELHGSRSEPVSSIARAIMHFAFETPEKHRQVWSKETVGGFSFHKVKRGRDRIWIRVDGSTITFHVFQRREWGNVAD